MNIPSQHTINELQLMHNELISNELPIPFKQAKESYIMHFEMMTGEAINSLSDARMWFDHWNGVEY